MFKSYFKKELTINNIGLKIKQNDKISHIKYSENTISIEFKNMTTDTILEFEK